MSTVYVDSLEQSRIDDAVDQCPTPFACLFKAKMHQIQFRLRLCPRTRWGAHSAPHTFYLDLRSLLLREGREKGVEWEGRGEGYGREQERRKDEGTSKVGSHPDPDRRTDQIGRGSNTNVCLGWQNTLAPSLYKSMKCDVSFSQCNVKYDI